MPIESEDVFSVKLTISSVFFFLYEVQVQFSVQVIVDEHQDVIGIFKQNGDVKRFEVLNNVPGIHSITH